MTRKPYEPPTATEVPAHVCRFCGAPKPDGTWCGCDGERPSRERTQRLLNGEDADPRSPDDIVLHPNGRCTCAGEGRCSWCKLYGRRGRLIAIEGLDGCGKSSVVEAIARELGALALAFPNDNAFTGPAIRSYLRREWACGHEAEDENGDGELVSYMATDHDLGALVFQTLQAINRWEVIPQILAALDSGRDVVLSRWWQSAWVYGQHDGLPRWWLERVHEKMPAADVSILLKITPEVGMRRRELRDGPKPPERYEGDLERLRKLGASFDELWELGWTIRPDGLWRVIDADRPLDVVIGDALRVAKGELS